MNNLLNFSAGINCAIFFATGSYQRPVGVAKNLSQKMCSVYIEEVTKALIHKNMLNKYIKFPETPAARQAISQRSFLLFNVISIELTFSINIGIFYICICYLYSLILYSFCFRFYAKYKIPGVIGCIDGSHFRIFGPPREEEHLYYCRKHYHSINVQMVQAILLIFSILTKKYWSYENNNKKKSHYFHNTST